MTLNIKMLDRICGVTIAGVAAICLGLVVIVGIQKQKEMVKEDELISAQSMKLELAQTKLKRFKDVLDYRNQQLASYNERIPRSPDIGIFFRQLDAMMRKNDLALMSVQPQPESKRNSFTRIPVRITFKGTFVNIYQLLNELESMGRIVAAEQITMVKTDRGQECRVDLLASIFKR